MTREVALGLLLLGSAHLARAEEPPASCAEIPGSALLQRIEAARPVVRSQATCAELEAAQRSLDAPFCPGDPVSVTAASLQRRILAQRKLRRCPIQPCTAQGCGPPRTEEIYEALLAAVNEERQRALDEAGAARLAIMETELARLAVLHLRDLDPRTPRYDDVERQLAIALSSNMDLFLKRLRGRSLSEPQLATLVELTLHYPGALERMAALLPGLEGVSQDDVVRLLEQAARLYEKTGGDIAVAQARLEAVEWLDDPKKAEALKLMLKSLAERHPRELEAVGQPSDPGLMAQKAIDFLEPIIRHQVGLEAALSNALLETEQGRSPILYHESPDVPAMKCESVGVGEFMRAFRSTADFRYGPESGLRPFELIGTADLDGVRSAANDVLMLGRGPEPLCREYFTLCDKPPFPGVYLIEFGRAATGRDEFLIARIEWWARSSESRGRSPPSPRAGAGRDAPEHGVLQIAPFSACDPNQARDAGANAVTRAVHEASIPMLVPPPLPAARPAHQSSGWHALGFAGAPFLADEKASTTSKLVPSLLDGLFLSGALVAAGASIERRNAYARGRIDSLAPADDAMWISLACAGALVVTRVASGVSYELWWKEKPEDRKDTQESP